VDLYKNGVVVRNGTEVSTSVPNLNIHILSSNGVALYSTKQISFAGVGSDLSAEASDFYTAIQTYMTSLGKQV
jgi:hypothetical protein